MAWSEVLGDISQEHADNMNYVAENLKEVMLAPGCGEYAYSDHISIEQMLEALSNLELVGLPVSWFVEDINIEKIKIKPGVEKRVNETDEPWLVSNYARDNAYQIHRSDSNDPSTVRYGGTPADKEVLSYAQALKNAGLKVTFYPLLMVDNENKDWRGLISGKAEHVEDFFIQYKDFVIHYALLLKDVVDEFYLGSELKGLTSIKSIDRDFPFVNNLITLASDVRKILGFNVQISYAANWDEYHGGDYCYLDPFWVDENIDFVGIDYYMPLTNVTSTNNITIQEIKNGFTSGEGIDFYYNKSKATKFSGPHAQWKNLELWHNNVHWAWDSEKGESYLTVWVPGLKPIKFSEFGYRSINYCTTQPNVHGDELPKGSNGEIDFPLQMKAIRATLEHIKDSSKFIKGGVCFCWDSRGNGWRFKFVDGKYWQGGHWIDGKIIKI